MSDMSMNVNPGVRGFTRTTWRGETSLRGVLCRLVEEHPNATRDEIKELYLAKIEMVPALVEEAMVRAFDNDWTTLHKTGNTSKSNSNTDEAAATDTAAKSKPERKKPARPTPEQAATEAVEVANLVSQIKCVVLLDLVQPNGKRLRDCTGDEAGEFGGWLAAIKARVGPAIIGETLSEADVVAIRAGSTSK